MRNSKLDFTRFFPEVYQAVAGENYIVYAYMNDGGVRAYDMKPALEKGGVFEPLRDETIFKTKLTVLNNTVAWDLSGKRDKSDCVDIDPFEVFDSPMVDDFPETI